MTSKKPKDTLSLHRTTLRSLSVDQLRETAGGFSWTPRTIQSDACPEPNPVIVVTPINT